MCGPVVFWEHYKAMSFTPGDIIRIFCVRSKCNHSDKLVNEMFSYDQQGTICERSLYIPNVFFLTLQGEHKIPKLERCHKVIWGTVALSLLKEEVLGTFPMFCSFENSRSPVHPSYVGLPTLIYCNPIT